MRCLKGSGFNAFELTDRLLPGRDGGKWIKNELFIDFMKMNKSKFRTSYGQFG